MNVFENIRDELVNYFSSEAMPKEAVEWYKRVSVPGAICRNSFRTSSWYRISTTTSREESSIAGSR